MCDPFCRGPGLEDRCTLAGSGTRMGTRSAGSEGERPGTLSPSASRCVRVRLASANLAIDTANGTVASPDHPP
jgi:hypothetical protein